MLDARTTELLTQIYGSVPQQLAQGIKTLLEEVNPATTDQPRCNAPLWDQRDVVLITYGDQIRSPGQPAIAALSDWLRDHSLGEVLSTVHLLPFFPYTSDDGFSVVDYLAIDPELGDWPDVSRLGQDFALMFDFVLNHASQQHAWFQAYLAGDPQHADFFIEVDPGVDVSQVVRPRSLPLLTSFQTAAGPKLIWTTFSPDQVDLNYANPAVLLAMIEILVQYARRGSRIVRLDAVTYLWKQLGTDCVHLPQTHAVVQLLRHIMDRVSPGTLILTETNVPHQENISYFGDGNEAHMVYQFSLPPLLLDAIHSGDTSVLRDWLGSLKLPSDNTTFFNFTASHDGIGVRPLEGLVPEDRVADLVRIVRQHGGRVSMRNNSDGTQSAYELNIAYIDAVADRQQVPESEHARRFLCTQAIMLSIQGMPAIYFHSLVGTPNDQAGVDASGQNRRINRHKYDRTELDTALDQPDGLQRRVFDGYRRLLQVRRRQAAFDPSASQEVLDLPGDGLLGFIRAANDGQKLAVLANLTDQTRQVQADQVDPGLRYDQLADERLSADDVIPMRPFQVRWLSAD